MCCALSPDSNTIIYAIGTREKRPPKLMNTHVPLAKPRAAHRRDARSRLLKIARATGSDCQDPDLPQLSQASCSSQGSLAVKVEEVTRAAGWEKFVCSTSTQAASCINAPGYKHSEFKTSPYRRNSPMSQGSTPRASDVSMILAAVAQREGRFLLMLLRAASTANAAAVVLLIGLRRRLRALLSKLPAALANKRRPHFSDTVRA